MDSDAVCVLCQTDEETPTTGPISTKEEVTAHQNCLLYSSGLYCRESPDFDDLFGFSVNDVLEERQRGQKLTCHSCKKRGATAGCENKRCQKSFHYPCAIQAGAHVVDGKHQGQFGLYCDRCKKTKLGLGDSNSPNSHSHNPKRKLDFTDNSGRKANKHSKRISSDESDSDAPNNSEGMSMYAPLESDDEEIASSMPDELPHGEHSLIAPGTSSDLQTETQDKAVQAEASAAPSDVKPENDQELLLEPTDASIDASNFWKDCVRAGSAETLFNDFMGEMTDIFTRITSGQASERDCDVALDVMMASGKLQTLVTQQQKDIQKKIAELQLAAAALKRVSAQIATKDRFTRP